MFHLLNTITNIAIEIIKQNPNASFGFMGAATSKEKNRKKNAKNINPDNTIRNTKRHRIYSLYVLKYFPPDVFSHSHRIQNSSCCNLLKNNRKELSKEFLDDYLNLLIQNKLNI